MCFGNTAMKTTKDDSYTAGLFRKNHAALITILIMKTNMFWIEDKNKLKKSLQMTG